MKRMQLSEALKVIRRNVPTVNEVYCFTNMSEGWSKAIISCWYHQMFNPMRLQPKQVLVKIDKQINELLKQRLRTKKKKKMIIEEKNHA